AVRDPHARADRQAVEADRRHPLRPRVLGSGAHAPADGGVGRDRGARYGAAPLRRHAGGRLRVPAQPPDRASPRADHGAGSRGAGDREDTRGEAQPGAAMTREDRQKLIDQYSDGYRVVAEALTGIDDEQLDARPVPGRWTAREVV